MAASFLRFRVIAARLHRGIRRPFHPAVFHRRPDSPKKSARLLTKHLLHRLVIIGSASFDGKFSSYDPRQVPPGPPRLRQSKFEISSLRLEVWPFAFPPLDTISETRDSVARIRAISKKVGQAFSLTECERSPRPAHETKQRNAKGAPAMSYGD